MKHPKHSMVRAATALMLLLSGAATIASAQTPAPTPGKMPDHRQGMPEMPGMSGMMSGPHHVLAMAYRENLITFARALQTQVAQSTIVDLELARPAVAEMRRSFDQMNPHHKAQMAMMGDMKMGEHTNTPMATAMQAMETHLTALDEHLTALESEVNASAPAPANVSRHVAEILKHCAEMSAEPVTAKPHQMP